MLLASTAASTLPDAALSGRPLDSDQLLLGVILQCASGLAGVLASLLVLAGALILFIRHYDKCAETSSTEATG